MKGLQKLNIFLLAVVLLVSMVSINGEAASKKKTPKLNKTKVTLVEGKTTKLTVKNSGGKKVKWSTSNKKVAKVSKGKVTAVKKGTAKIKAKVGKKTIICKITVKDKWESNPNHRATAHKYDQWGYYIADGCDTNNNGIEDWDETVTVTVCDNCGYEAITKYYRDDHAKIQVEYDGVIYTVDCGGSMFSEDHDAWYYPAGVTEHMPNDSKTRPGQLARNLENAKLRKDAEENNKPDNFVDGTLIITQ